MSFHPISTTIGGAKTWNESGPGVYSESTVLFGQPRSQINITGGKYNPKTGLVTSSCGRLLEKIIVLNGVSQIGLMVVTQQISVPRAAEFTVADLDNSSAIISEIITAQFLERNLKGER